MRDWSWKQAVPGCVLDLVTASGKVHFVLADLYGYVDALQERFPRNRHVRPKLRQSLQKLRDDGILIFHGGGSYSVNLEHEEVAVVPSEPLLGGMELPTRHQVAHTVCLRNTLLASCKTPTRPRPRA